MVMRSLRTRIAFTSALAALLLGTSNCMAGPFERVNPNDPVREFTLHIVSTVDTLSPSHPRSVLQVVTEPAMTGFEPFWSLPLNSMLYHAGNGVFAVADLPLSVQSIVVTAGFQDKTATYTLYVRPTP